jgi:DNA-3-methyladenine glycosylase II
MAFLAVPEPFDFALTTERFRAFGVDRASLWHEGGLHRVVGGREVRIEAAPGGVDVEPLGLDFDLDAFYAWAAEDEVLVTLVPPLAGFRPPVIPDPFEMLVGAITAQQVSLIAATAIRNRFIERFGVQAGEAWAFPTRERIARAHEDELFAIGLTRRKSEYVVGLARSDLDLAGLAALPDDEVKVRLTEIRGLGDWTADWFLARHLGRPHAWPAGDLVLRKAVTALYRGLDVHEAGARFHPFENLTAHYLLLSRRTP